VKTPNEREAQRRARRPAAWSVRTGERHKRPRRVDRRDPSSRLIVFTAGEHPAPLVDDRDLSGGGLDGVKLSDDAGELHLDPRAGLQIGHGAPRRREMMVLSFIRTQALE